MSGRIETAGSRMASDNKFSKNEIMSVRKAGVDIGEDLEVGGGDCAKTAGKVSKVTSKTVGTIGTSGLQENYEEENDNE